MSAPGQHWNTGISNSAGYFKAAVKPRKPPDGAVGAAGARRGIPRQGVMQRQPQERGSAAVRVDGIADEGAGLLLRGPAGLCRLAARHG